MFGKLKNFYRTAREAAAAKAENILNDISLKHKLMGLYLFCVLMPLFATDSVVLSMIVRADRAARQQEMRNTAEAVIYSMETTVENAVSLSQNVYRNKYVNEFIETEYQTPLEYYEAYLAFLRGSLYETVMGSSLHTVIYADNPGFVNGGYFSRLEMAEGTEWYEAFLDSGREAIVVPWFDNTGINNTQQKYLSIVRKMDYYHKGTAKDVLRMDLDYSSMSGSITNGHYANTVYVCCSDKILFSNDKKGGITMPFIVLEKTVRESAGVHSSIEMYGYTWDIYVMDNTTTALGLIQDNFGLILFLLLVNLLFPYLLVKALNRSFTRRLRALGTVFETAEADRLQPISEAKGKDEIGVLMRSYNRMAGRMNELIQTVYKDKLKEQEMDIAKQAAELLALHSQINPHFLFNALESIRMHSLLKKEYEIADMVEKLAVMQRQNVEWSQDAVRMSDEVQFVEAYLELQKYRFGERLSYRIEMDSECGGMKIPKLTLVTFTENACVHGIENKTAPGWIFVRVFVRKEQLYLEIEDTGKGMAQEQLFELQEKMNRADISQLKEKGRVGILNACVRLKMATRDRVVFELDSEEDVGTIVTIRIPLEALEGAGKEGEEDAEGTAGGR